MLLIAPEAEQDLVDIWLFIAEDSPANADNFVDRLYAQARQLADFPLSGKPRPELGDQIHMFPLERYLLFYQPLARQDNGIVLVRVLHSARDIQQL
jgi:toxin ParE1/3/4